MTTKAIVILGLLSVATSIASATPHEYYNVNQQHILRVGLFSTCDASPSLDGSVCIDDCVPAFSDPLDPTGECTITVVDDLFSPVLARYCQDLNDDVFCGGAPGEPANARTEPRVTFCDSITVNTPINLTPRGTGLWIGGPVSDPATTWVTDNWDPDSSILIFLSGATQSNPALPGPCGATFAMATHGFVFHT